MSKRSLLFLGHTLPYPPDSGASVRTYNILKILATTYDVTGLFFYRKATHPTPSHVRHAVHMLSDIARLDVFPIPQEQHRVRLLWDHLRSLSTTLPYTYYTYYSRHYRDAVARICATRSFDIVHVDSLDLSAYFPALPPAPVVCAHHNLESLLLRRRASAQRSIGLRTYMRIQAEFTRRHEIRWAPRVALNVLVSDPDRSELIAAAPQAHAIVVPNGASTKAFRPTSPSERNGIVFVGPASWQPNLEAMLYFANDILPAIRSRIPKVQVFWAGRVSDELRQRFQHDFGIHTTGYVEDIRSVLGTAAVCIVPLRTGGGTRLKILDAWALGVPVVSTSIGCEGLSVRDGDNILVRDTPAAFADAVTLLLQEQQLRSRIGSGGRDTAVTRYDWEVIGAQMLPEYQHLLGPQTT